MKIKYKLYIHRGANKSSYFFTCDELNIQTKVHQHDFDWYINKLKTDYNLIFANDSNPYKDALTSDYGKDFSKEFIVYKNK